jgi:hypothetical protein
MKSCKNTQLHAKYYFSYVDDGEIYYKSLRARAAQQPATLNQSLNNIIHTNQLAAKNI